MSEEIVAVIQVVATYEEAKRVGAALDSCFVCQGLGYYFARITGSDENVRIQCRFPHNEAHA